MPMREKPQADCRSDADQDKKFISHHDCRKNNEYEPTHRDGHIRRHTVVVR